MRKLAGTFVVLFPFLVIFGFILLIDWRAVVFILSALILIIDIGCWFFWFYLAGKSIIENDKSYWEWWTR